jgi:hypothetical protein
MYLTDDREATVKDIITQHETDLFERVTSLSLKDFARLDAAGVFNPRKMNDAVWKFRDFEEPSLHYGASAEVETRGGWNVRRDERFAALVNAGVLMPGDELSSGDSLIGAVAVVTDDYGLLVDGIRHESPDAAAQAATEGAVSDGWDFWVVRTAEDRLATLHALVAAATPASSGSSRRSPE